MFTLGEYITRLRAQKNFSQRELARKVGISFTTIVCIENGQTKNPGLETVLSIAKALNVPDWKLILAYKGVDPDFEQERLAFTDEEFSYRLKQLAKELEERGK